MSDFLPRGEAKVKAVRAMFDAVAPRYEMVNRIISLGLDQRWRRRAFEGLELAPRSTVVDIASGTGDFCRLVESHGHIVVGVDLSLGMLENARTAAPLLQADALQLPFRDNSVDAVTCGFALRNFVELPPFFAEMNRILKPGGKVAFLDAAQPQLPLVRTGHHVWFGVIAPRIGALLSDRQAYAYLPKSLAYLPPAGELVAMVQDAGFTQVRHTSLLLGCAQLIIATRSS